MRDSSADFVVLIIKIDQIKYVIVTDFIEKARKFSHVAMKNICIISDYKNHEFLGIRSHFSFVVVQFEVEMNEVALRTLLNWLLTCNALFDGPMPNLAEFKVFEYDDGEIRMKTLDWNGSFASSQIYISDTIEGANLQMVVSGEKIELGGQVTVKIRGAYLGHCPVAGDTSEVRVVIDKGLCSPDFLVYRIKDRLYAIGQNGWTASRIISLYGSVIEERKVSVVAKDNFGVNQTKGTLVYKDGYGMCQELTAGSLSSSWESRFCDDEKITLVPNETSEWHHVQYLQIVHNCELDPAIPRDELKNVYVRFMHVPPKPKARRRGLLTERGKVLVGLSAGFLGVVLIAFVGSAPFWYKWSPWGGAWRREKKPVPNTDLEKDGWSSNRDRDDDAPRDSYGNVDWNLLTRDYRDQYRDVDFKETFNDEDFGLPLPKITDDSFSLRFRYEHVKTLSHGKMRAVHQYGIGGGSFVAIKFMVAKDEVEMERAKQEIALLRFFWESHKSNQESPVCLRCAARKNPGLRRSKTRRQSCAPMRTSQECDQDHAQERKEPHLAKVGDSGHYQNVIFYSMNFFARSIQDVLEDLPCSNYGQKLNVCYQMLQGILELQRLGYAHGDLKPANYMQKRLNDNLLRIVGFGFVQKFGAKRPAGCGTLEYMSLPALRGQEVSMVDDMQSWFHCCVVVLTGEFAYSRPTPDETEGLVELYLKAQTEDVPQYPSKDDEIIAMLRDLIWDKPPGNTIDMAAVSKTLDEFRDKFEFKYTDPWWDSLPVEKPSSAKSGKQSETTKKSKKS